MRVGVVRATGGDAEGALPFGDVLVISVVDFPEVVSDSAVHVALGHPSGLEVDRVDDGYHDIFRKIHVAIAEVPPLVVAPLHDGDRRVDGLFEFLHRSHSDVVVEGQLFHVDVHLVQPLETARYRKAVQRQEDSTEVHEQRVVGVGNPVVQRVNDVFVFFRNLFDRPGVIIIHRVHQVPRGHRLSAVDEFEFFVFVVFGQILVFHDGYQTHPKGFVVRLSQVGGAVFFFVFIVGIHVFVSVFLEADGYLARHELVDGSGAMSAVDDGILAAPAPVERDGAMAVVREDGLEVFLFVFFGPHVGALEGCENHAREVHDELAARRVIRASRGLWKRGEHGIGYHGFALHVFTQNLGIAIL